MLIVCFVIHSYHGSHISNHYVSSVQAFVDAMEDVKNVVDKLHAEVTEMSSECSEMKQKLQQTKSETKHLIMQTDSLQKHRYLWK